MNGLCLNHHFLLATPSIEDPIFRGALIYLCEHKAQGATGVIINKPSDIALSQLFETIGLASEKYKLPFGSVLFGGPVELTGGFVLHPSATENATDAPLILNTSRDSLAAIAQKKGSEELLVTVGHTSWSKGQLEKELAQNAWLIMPASSKILFKVPPQERYEAAMASFGLKRAFLSSQIGYA